MTHTNEYQLATALKWLESLEYQSQEVRAAYKTAYPKDVPSDSKAFEWLTLLIDACGNSNSHAEQVMMSAYTAAHPVRRDFNAPCFASEWDDEHAMTLRAAGRGHLV